MKYRNPVYFFFIWVGLFFLKENVDYNVEY